MDNVLDHPALDLCGCSDMHRQKYHWPRSPPPHYCHRLVTPQLKQYEQLQVFKVIFPQVFTVSTVFTVIAIFQL